MDDENFQKLQAENEILKQQLAQSTSKEIADLRAKYNKLKKVLETGNYSNLESIIDNFMIFSKSQLKKLSAELQLSEYDPVEKGRLRDFLNYLFFVQHELERFLDVPSPASKDDVLKECKEEIDQMCKIVQGVDLTDFQEHELTNFYLAIKKFNDVLGKQIKAG